MEPTATPDEPAAGNKWDAFTAVRWGDQALAWARRVLTTARFEAAESWAERLGHHALIVAAGLGLLFGIVGAFKWDHLSPFLMGLAWLPCVAVAQYAAFKFSSTSRGLITSSGSQLSSSSFLSCIALWSLLLGVIVLVSNIYVAIRMESLSALWWGVGTFAACELVACLCLNPALLNIVILPATTGGEEAVGVLGFSLKTALRLIPIAFGVGVIAGDLDLLAALVRLLRGREHSMDHALSAAWQILGSAALPLLGYVLFVLNYLALDLIRALLSLPGKLDALAKK